MWLSSVVTIVIHYVQKEVGEGSAYIWKVKTVPDFAAGFPLCIVHNHLTCHTLLQGRAKLLAEYMVTKIFDQTLDGSFESSSWLTLSFGSHSVFGLSSPVLTINPVKSF